ncbi:hypothetical protein niasHT_018391 [Heterodera trifolii]|uniref:Uncharacterized protein n=1 Tax=Heterodera trifolii TaxID=157864 RepID=A0ABD2LDD5_9BILA
MKNNWDWTSRSKRAHLPNSLKQINLKSRIPLHHTPQEHLQQADIVLQRQRGWRLFLPVNKSFFAMPSEEFFRAVCYSLFGIDNQENSDALRQAASRTLLTIVSNPNFYPGRRYSSHADFINQLRNALVTT